MHGAGEASKSCMDAVMLAGRDPACLYRLLGPKKRPSGRAHHVQWIGRCMPIWHVALGAHQAREARTRPFMGKEPYFLHDGMRMDGADE